MRGKENGITLVALVVTTIVLLILAGVTITLTLGDNGIIKKAETASEKAETSQELEQVVLAAHKAVNINVVDGKDLEEALRESISKVDQGASVTKFGDVYKITFPKTNNEYFVREDGKVTKKEGIICTDIAAEEDKSKYYGAKVTGYELPNTTKTDVSWKIFYADENNIYLIADNYVERENLPNSTTEDGKQTKNKPNTGDKNEIKYERTAFFTNILADYNGSARITDSKLKRLNKSYFYKTLEDGSEVDNFSSTKPDMKAVAYMMDTNAWNSKFKDVKNKAEYVIGGPTIEMLMKSYSQRYKVNYQARAKDAAGYEVSKDGGSNWGTTYYGMLKTEQNLSTKGAHSMWVASPSTASNAKMMTVGFDGTVSSYDCYANVLGFRPLICLKSNVELKQNGDGTYTIK